MSRHPDPRVAALQPVPRAAKSGSVREWSFDETLRRYFPVPMNADPMTERGSARYSACAPSPDVTMHARHFAQIGRGPGGSGHRPRRTQAPAKATPHVKSRAVEKPRKAVALRC